MEKKLLYLGGPLGSSGKYAFRALGGFLLHQFVRTDFVEPPTRSFTVRATGEALRAGYSGVWISKLLSAKCTDAGELMQRAPEADMPNIVRCGCALR